ncbi:helix-turn-helix domain-containing protein [Alisedimentitalea sp. MJ-SS2]|uniref:helix-turn-helix domain-containing protein n=1 Tax=Aliisedimentitalea sp. MJ-SS2 TaxID=3049795 RepID=UPI0029075D53|nr:helix-turn-helix domain-containing protein [Alisedimentitalea sp. MJ-SS2]MDU8929673.1 helix-turn-helix domain-containing protein [Alisedimentitalea sp. MJ-SS2]
MAVRPPLDLKQKYFAQTFWAQEQPRLTQSAFVVLSRLIYRQNIKTGQCDPSVATIMDDTGLCERSVRKAFRELEKRGAVKSYRRSQRSRNQFVVFSVDEIKQHKKQAGRDPSTISDATLHGDAVNPARPCRRSLHPGAPENIKEKNKEEIIAENARKTSTGPGTPCGGAASPDVSEGDFERRVAKVFERQGYGYEGLLELEPGFITSTYEAFCRRELDFNSAITQLLKAYRSIDGAMK